MPKITGGITAAIVAVLLFTGCANASPATGAADGASTSPSPTETAAPLVAETSPAADSYSSAEEEFLAEVRPELESINTVIPDATDAQLLAAASAACEQMSQGVDSAAVHVIDGEQPNGLDIYESSAKIAAWASEVGLCG